MASPTESGSAHSASTSPPTRPVEGEDSYTATEAYFDWHFTAPRVYVDKIGEVNISIARLAPILEGISEEARIYFIDAKLPSIFVCLNTIAELHEFAPIALDYPFLRGRIKLDSRQVYEPELTRGVLSDEEQARRGEMSKGLTNWKEEVCDIIKQVREQCGLDEDGFKTYILHQTPLPPTKSEQTQLAHAKANNPRSRAAFQIPNDLKTLTFKDIHTEAKISCDTILFEDDKSPASEWRLQIWGDIGRLQNIWEFLERDEAGPSDDKTDRLVFIKSSGSSD